MSLAFGREKTINILLLMLKSKVRVHTVNVSKCFTIDKKKKKEKNKQRKNKEKKGSYRDRFSPWLVLVGSYRSPWGNTLRVGTVSHRNPFLRGMIHCSVYISWGPPSVSCSETFVEKSEIDTTRCAPTLSFASTTTMPPVRGGFISTLLLSKIFANVILKFRNCIRYDLKRIVATL